MSAAGPGPAGRGDWRRVAAERPILLTALATVLVSLLFVLWPALDLWVSGLFYDPAVGFPAADQAALQTLRDVGTVLVVATLAALLGALVIKLIAPRRRSLVPPSVSLFLVLLLALGPGLLVNGILKNFSGRPRPIAVDAFGGASPYVPVWQLSDYCSANCSFVSGEASSAIWLVALTAVVPARWRTATFLVTLAIAAALSLNRIAFGAHFLSDVLIAWGLTLLLAAMLHRIVIAQAPAFLQDQRLEAGLTRIGLRLRGRTSPEDQAGGTKDGGG